MLFACADWLVPFSEYQVLFTSMQSMRQNHMLRVWFLTSFWYIERNKLIFWYLCGILYTNKFIYFCQCQWNWWKFTKLRSSVVNIHHCSPSGLWLKLLSVQKVVLLHNQISQWRLAVRNVKKATSIKGLVHKFQAYCSHASKCLQLRHGALYKASRHHHDDIYTWWQKQKWDGIFMIFFVRQIIVTDMNSEYS